MTHQATDYRSSFLLAAFCFLVIAVPTGLLACRSDSPPAGRAGAKPTASSAATAAGSGAATTAAARGSAKAGFPLDQDGRMSLAAGDRCPVCAMSVKENAKFASAIALDDGTTYYFCGTGCMMRSWLHPEQFLGVDRKRLTRAVAQEYFTGKNIDAAAVVWVAGSDVVGPMGPAIVPLADDAAVAKFKERHGGKTTFKLGELTDETWEQMTGKKAGR